jgi:hypothetical protein
VPLASVVAQIRFAAEYPHALVWSKHKPHSLCQGSSLRWWKARTRLRNHAGVAQRLQHQFCKLAFTVGSSPTAGSIIPIGPSVQSVNPKWLETGLVLVCERCYKERIPEEAPEAAERIGDFNLRDWLKRELKAHGEWGPIRVVSTSCLDVCSKDRVTVCLDPKNGNDPEILVIDPIDERDELYRKVVALRVNVSERE